MPVYSFPFPPALSADVGASGRVVNSTAQQLRGLLDLAFDPLTRDLVDEVDGSLVETSDSRTAVLFQIEAAVDAWWADPTQGSRISSMLSSSQGESEAATISDVVDEVKRCLQALVDDGIIMDLSVSIDHDEAGRPVIVMNYRDRSTGTAVDLAYVPFNA